MRLRIYRIVLSSCLATLSLFLFFTQVLRGGYFYDLSLRNSIRLIPQEPYRGRIFDRNNNIMVDNILSFDAVIIPQELKDRETVLAGLSKVLGADSEALRRNYDRGYLNPFTPVPVVRSVSKTAAITIEEQALDLPGVHIELNAKRFYPFSTSASHVLGYMGEIDRSRITRLRDYGYDIKDKVGYSGLEENLDIHLRGEKGGQQVEVDNRGRQVRLLGYKPPSPGKDVQVTIDLELQQMADALLSGRKGAFVLMDAATGEVLVLSSAPSFDPNVFVDRKDREAIGRYLTSREAPLFNRAISGRFPPASVFKVVTAAAALKAKKISPSTTFVCSGGMKVGNRFFKCWDAHGPQDFYQAVAHSCDVYFYHLGILSGPDALTGAAREFGFAEATGIDLPGEATGFIPSRMWKRLTRFDNWYDGDTANFSIGQGYVLVTPLQLCRMMAAVANGGYLVEPHLTKAVGGAGVSRKEPKKIKIADNILELLKTALRLPVRSESGTAHIMEIAGWDICAKTGTAQVYGQESHGWVAGFFPQRNPRYAFCILLENVNSSYYACQLASQFFREAKQRNKLL